MKVLKLCMQREVTGLYKYNYTKWELKLLSSFTYRGKIVWNGKIEEIFL